MTRKRRKGPVPRLVGRVGQSSPPLSGRRKICNGIRHMLRRDKVSAGWGDRSRDGEGCVIWSALKFDTPSPYCAWECAQCPRSLVAQTAIITLKSAMTEIKSSLLLLKLICLNPGAWFVPEQAGIEGGTYFNGSPPNVAYTWNYFCQAKWQVFVRNDFISITLIRGIEKHHHWTYISSSIYTTSQSKRIRLQMCTSIECP